MATQVNSNGTNDSRKTSDASEVSSLSSHADGLVRNGGGDGNSSPEAVLHPPEHKEELWELWGKVVTDWETGANYKKQTNFIRDLVREGIPTQFRAIAWQLLARADTLEAKHDYVKLLRQASPCEKVIKRDIARTFPEHEFFKDKDGPGQERLFNVMKAFSVFDQEVGYCQGSAFLVGVLLFHMPEEDAFAVFIRMMNEYRMREMYKPSMAELGLCIYQLECMVQELLPELYNHFQSQNYHTSMYSSSWFLTLFTSSLPLRVANRAIDLFLSEGMEAIFRLGCAILIICKEDLLRYDMENLMRYFQKEMPNRIDADPDYWVHVALQVKYDAKKMKKLCKDYTTLKVKEQEEMVELRRLRTENRLLRSRVEVLEQESAELADKLIQGQVCRAQEAEDNYVIKRELAASKTIEDQCKRELDEAYGKMKTLQIALNDKKTFHIKEAQMLVESLQEELVAVKLREAETSDEMKHVRERNELLEEQNERLRELPPDHGVAQLQEELIAVKLREAEAQAAMKDVRAKISDLNTMWEEHLATAHPAAGSTPSEPSNSQPSSLDTGSAAISSKETSLDSNNTSPNGKVGNGSASGLSPSSITAAVTSSPLKMMGNALKRVQNGSSNNTAELTSEIQRLKQEVITSKMRETEAVAEVKELRQRMMEFETQIQVSHNQIRRQADEMERVKKSLEGRAERERDLEAALKAEQRKFADQDFKVKEEQMMRRIADIEQTQLIAELRQKVSALEAKNEELIAIGKLTQSGSEPLDARDLNNRMAELQSEMFRLDVCNKKLESLHQLTS